MIEWPAEIDLEEDRIDDFQPPKKPWYWYPKQVILLIFVMISYFLIHNGRLIREEGYGLILSGIALLVISTMLLLEDPPVRIPETQTLTKAVCRSCGKEYIFDFKEGDSVYSEISKCLDCKGSVEIISIFSVDLLSNGKAHEKEEMLKKQKEEHLKMQTKKEIDKMEPNKILKNAKNNEQ